MDAILHDVVSSQLGLQWPWEGEHDVGILHRVCPRLGRWTPRHVGSLDVVARRLVIMVEEGTSTPKFDYEGIFWGAYEGAHGGVYSWSEDGDMVNNHHYCMRESYCGCVNGPFDP